jgi:catechol 2,3-dioxygenase-like lactoylglutathione lyase family enzyme
VISHVFIGITDFERALRFYSVLLAVLGLERRFCERDTSWAGWSRPDAPRPLLVIGKPFDGRAARPGNGNMVALFARNRAEVDQAHALALTLGGCCEGPPGLRTQYHANYYGAYFRDPDQNKLCVCCHDPTAG